MNDLIIERIVIGDLETNCYLLADRQTKKGFIIDPGGESEKIKRAMKKHAVVPAGIINTHGHFDHIRGDGDFGLPVYIHREDIPFLKDPVHNFSSLFPPPYAYEGEVIPLNDGDTLPLGERSITVIHTPGHTPGSICLLIPPSPRLGGARRDVTQWACPMPNLRRDNPAKGGVHTGTTDMPVGCSIAPVLFSGDTLFYRSIGRTDMDYADQESLISSIHRKLLSLPSDTVVFPGHGARTSIEQESAENPFIRG